MLERASWRVSWRLPRGPVTVLAAVMAAMACVFGLLAPGFLTLGNLVGVIEGCSVAAIMAVGLYVVLVAGGIDISFAATASVAQYVGAYAATEAHWPVVWVVSLSVVTGALLGALNAVLIDRLRATSIIITISTMSVYFALLMYFTGGRSIYDLPRCKRR